MSLIKKQADYVLNLIKWFSFSVIIGIICAFAGALFHNASDLGAELFGKYPLLIFALPISGVIIVFLYNVCRMDNNKGTSGILTAAREGNDIRVTVAPLILISTALTHLCGGSAGREGAALQIGGSLGAFIAKLLKLKNQDVSVFIMCGMSGLFSAVFGTPITAAIFAVEVICVGIIRYNILFPTIISAVTAKFISQLLGIKATSFAVTNLPSFELTALIKVLILSLLTALLSILFVTVLHKTSYLFSKYFSNKYIRVIIGSILIILMTLVLNTRDYNGTGMPLVIKAVETGAAEPGAFILKMIFTAITLSAGFKGGEIVPTFCIGATFGVFIAPVIGLSPSFAAAIGLIALFCGVVNCPVASVILSIELFGAEGLIFFAIASATSFLLSGNFSLYSSQEFVFSKLSHTDDRKIFEISGKV